MKTTKMLTILVLTLGLLVWLSKVSEAAPLGTAFTYQGRLIDANEAADGLYDFQFKLFDANNDGNQLNGDVNTPNVDVIDGSFAIKLDFGGVFDGNERWLEIGVRPGDQNDPNVYTLLSPRQEVTPTPYSLYAKTAGGVASGIVGGGTSNYVPKFLSSNSIGNSVIYESAGNVGIGTTSPAAKLNVVGQVKITGGSPAAGKVLTSDATGLASWQSVPADGDWTISGSNIYSSVSGNVGIGTTSPSTKLDVAGVITSTGGNSNNWNTSYGHKTTEDLINGLVKCNGSGTYSAITDNSANWNTAYSWGNHATAGYLKTESDPKVSSVTTNSVSKWNGATLVDGTIYDNGNVGIGTSDPQSALHVEGVVTADKFAGSGALPWQEVMGTSQQAMPNTGYIANSAAQVTITLPASPNYGQHRGSVRGRRGNLESSPERGTIYPCWEYRRSKKRFRVGLA
jgi:hypothetical protein